MKFRQLGKTGISVSEVGFGAWAVGGAAKAGGMEIGWGHLDDETSVAAVHAAIDAGINFFDTANTYGMGHSEEVLGRAFEGRRDKVVICSKVGNRPQDGQGGKDFSRGGMEKEIEGSLRRLRTEYLDVYLAHSPKIPDDLPEDWYVPFEGWKKQGKIRSYGISIGPPADGLWMIEGGHGEVIQVIYNVLKREPEEALFGKALDNGIGIIARVPLASGFLSGKYSRESRFADGDRRKTWTDENIAARVAQAEAFRFLEGERTMVQGALRFCLDHSAVSTVIPGAKTPEQVEENASASDLPSLSEQEHRMIREI